MPAGKIISNNNFTQVAGGNRIAGNILSTSFAGGVNPSPRTSNTLGWYNAQQPPAPSFNYVSAPTAPGGYEWRIDYAHSSPGQDIGEYWLGLAGASYNRLYAHTLHRMTSQMLTSDGSAIKKHMRFRDVNNNDILGGCSWIFADMSSSISIGLDLFYTGSHTVNGVAHNGSVFSKNVNSSYNTAASTFVGTARHIDLMFDWTQRAAGIIECAVWVDGTIILDYTGANSIHGCSTSVTTNGGACEFMHVYNATGPDAGAGTQSDFIQQLELSSSSMF